MSRNRKPVSERRRYPRVAREMGVRLNAGGGDLCAKTIDISRNGAYCRVSAPIPVMTKLRVRLEVPAAGRKEPLEAIECGGVVVRAERAAAGRQGGYNIGIFFNQITRDAMAKVSRLAVGVAA